MYELNRITLAVQEALIEGHAPSSVEGVRRNLRWDEMIPPMKIKRLRRQFVSIAQTNPPSIALIGDLFVDYINETL